MRRMAVTLIGWAIIAGVLIILAPVLVFRAAVQLWRRIETQIIFYGDAAAQEKTRWHLR